MFEQLKCVIYKRIFFCGVFNQTFRSIINLCSNSSLQLVFIWMWWNCLSVLSWRSQKPWGTRPVCPSPAASGRTAECWRPTAPRPSTPGPPSARAPAWPWSPLSFHENQKPLKCLNATTNKQTINNNNQEENRIHSQQTGVSSCDC